MNQRRTETAPQFAKSGVVEQERGDSETLARCSTYAARGLVPLPLALRLRALPLGIASTSHGKVLAVACEEKTRVEVQASLRFSTGVLVKTIPVQSKLLEHAIHFAYCGDQQMLQDRVEALREQARECAFENAYALEVPHSDAEVPSFCRALLTYAYAHRASDIHLSPTDAGTKVAIRVDGELLERQDSVASLEQHKQIVRHIKVLAELDPSKRTIPQDGSFCQFENGMSHAVRVSVMPTVRGERVVLRLANAALVPALDELGLNSRTHAQLKEIMRHGEGAILLSGSTGSGKTTTLYSVIRELRDNGSTVSSIEDPVEVELEGVAQTSIGDESSGLDYLTCLKAVLRQDPDIIMVGELRDKQSALSALQAALSGHLVLSTVHAASVFQILPRLSLLGLDAGLVSDAVSMLVFQRLIPRLCPRCRVTDLLASHRVGFETFRAVGCPNCHHQGYLGRVLVNESLVLDEPTRSRAFARENLEKLKDCLLKSGSYVPQDEQLEALARRGEIDSMQLASTTQQLHVTPASS